MNSGDCPYIVMFYGALFKEVIVLSSIFCQKYYISMHIVFNCSFFFVFPSFLLSLLIIFPVFLVIIQFDTV